MTASKSTVFVPAYYPDFHCIADKCQHSCCIGWEIDVDEAALARYKQVGGPLGEKLSRCIAFDGTEDGASTHFILQGKEERCPFLNERNLCELILDLGEDSLCNICRDHPRFRNFYSDCTELGLGLCCEEAARILLTRQTPFRLVPLEAGAVTSTQEQPETAVSCDEKLPMDGLERPDSSTTLDPEEARFFEFRDSLFQILANTRQHWTLRVNQVCDAIDVPTPDIDPAKWGNFLLTLERLDPAWDEELNRLTKASAFADETVSGTASDLVSNNDVQASNMLFTFRNQMQTEGRSEEWIRLLEYFLFRHLNGALENEEDEDGNLCITINEIDLRARVLFAVLAVTLLEWLGAAHFLETGRFTLEDQIELVRMFSSEIEYSDENVGLILDEIAERFL